MRFVTSLKPRKFFVVFGDFNLFVFPLLFLQGSHYAGSNDEEDEDPDDYEKVGGEFFLLFCAFTNCKFEYDDLLQIGWTLHLILNVNINVISVSSFESPVESSSHFHARI